MTAKRRKEMVEMTNWMESVIEEVESLEELERFLDGIIAEEVARAIAER